MKFRNQRIAQQLLIYFFSLTVLPLLAVSLLCFLVSAYIIGTKANSYANETIVQLSGNIDNLLSQYELTSLSTIYNSNIQDTLHLAKEKTDITRTQIYKMEQSMILSYDYSAMRDITIFAEDMMFRVPHQNEQYPPDYYPPADLEIPPHRSVWYNNPDQQVVQMVRNIESAKNYSTIGRLCISFYSGFLDGLTHNINFDTDGFLLILDETGTPVMIHQTEEDFLTMIREEATGLRGSFTRRVSGKLYTFYYETSEQTGWKSVGVISLNRLFRQVWQLGMAVLGGMILISLIAVRLSRRLSESFSARIHLVTDAMKLAAKGDFSVTLPLEDSTNEFNDLSKGFNHMVAKINSLIDTVYKTQLLQKESEFKALQAQINPHFLYNTLDTICWQAKLRNNEDIFQTTLALANLLRVSVGNKKVFVTFAEEIQYVNDYLQIQKARFRDKIATSIRIVPELMLVQIPKLILQPIVENAFVHGLELKCGKGCLTIFGDFAGNDAIVRIHDNGIGMNQEQIQKIFSPTHTDSGESIGLINVHKRLQIIYGEAYGLAIESVPEEGTCVTLRFPVFPVKQEDFDAKLK